MEDFLDYLKPFLKPDAVVSVEKEDWQNDDAATGVITKGKQTLRFSISGGDDLGAWFNYE